MLPVAGAHNNSCPIFDLFQSLSRETYSPVVLSRRGKCGRLVKFGFAVTQQHM